MKYFSKAINGISNVTTLLDLNDVPFMTSCKINLQINALNNAVVTVKLRGANGDSFILHTQTVDDAAGASIDITDIILNTGALPGQAAPLTKLEMTSETANSDAYLCVEVLEG